MQQYTDGKRVINATEKAFEAIYKKQGFRKYDELEQKGVRELKEIAKEKGLEGYSNLNKEELIKLLKGD